VNASHASADTMASPPRRHFLKLLFTLFGLAWGGMTLYPLYRYLRPSGPTTVMPTVTRVSAGPAEALPEGQGKNLAFGNIPAIVTHTQDGAFHAFNATCTHLGCTVQFRADINRIWCACHGGQYDPITGAVLAGPPPRPLAPLRASVEEGEIIVSQEPAPSAQTAEQE